MITQRLATYMSEAVESALPPAVLEKTRHHVLDTLAAMVSGSRLLPGRSAISYVQTLGGVPEATVAGSGLVTTAQHAALANGMLAHADETDDSHAPSLSHPGCGIVPAALAMAERENSNVMSFFRAVALGYDVGSRVNMSLGAYRFREDGHSTHSFGPTIGAAAAAGALARLDYDRTRYVLSYAAQQASGLSCWTADREHIEKAFDFGGMPARDGVAAASMVAHGFTAVDDVFSGERSFFVAYGEAPRPEELIRELGSTFEIMNTNIKRWSVGSPIQAPLDSLLELIRANQVTSEDVEEVVVQVGTQGATTTNNRSMPDICMQHMCAVMLVDGIVTFESAHNLAYVNDPRIQAMRARIRLVPSDELERVMPSRQGIVELRLKDGRELRHHTTAVRGTSDNPMTRNEVEEKAHYLMVPILGEERARSLCELILQIEGSEPIRKLRPLRKLALEDAPLF